MNAFNIIQLVQLNFPLKKPIETELKLLIRILEFSGSSENQLVFISSLYFSNPWQWNNRIPFHLKQVEIMKELEFIKQENISFILSNFALGSRTDLAMGSELINKRSGTIKEFGSGTRHGLMTEAGAYTNELNQFCLIFNNQSELPVKDRKSSFL